MSERLYNAATRVYDDGFRAGKQVSAARIAALEAENAALRKALRTHAVRLDVDDQGYSFCRVCFENWTFEQPEQHKPNCLAA